MDALVVDFGELQWLEKTKRKEMGREAGIYCVDVPVLPAMLEGRECLKALS